MIDVRKEVKGNVLAIRLSGAIDETVDFQEFADTELPEIHLNCREVARINSMGVKGWISFFQNLQARGVKLRFVECSPVVVDQMNQIRNFACGGVVESIFLPFSCVQCKRELLGLFKVANFKQGTQIEIPSQKCIHCGGVAEFDDIPSEYFRFLWR